MVRSALVIALVATTATARAETLGTPAAPPAIPHATAHTSTPRPVVGFRVRGKSKLTERALEYLTHVDHGDLVSAEDIPQIVRSLITSELFEKVDVVLEAVPGGVVLVAILDDKHSWIIAPTLFVLPGKKAVGAGFAENNFGGRNQKMLFYGQLGDRESLLFGTYLDPSVHGSQLTWRFDLYAYRRTNSEFENPPEDPTSLEIMRDSTATYLGGGALIGWAFRWWMIADLRMRGAYVFYEDSHAPDGTPLPAPQTDGWDVAAQARLTFDGRGNHYGVTWGPYLQLKLDTTIPGLDDYDYSIALLRAYYSWRIFDRHQLELRTHLQAGRHLPFHEELTLGGVIDLRGYRVDQFRGDVRTMFRAEYSVPIAKWRFFAFRAIGFWDTGYIGYHFPRQGGDRHYFYPAQGRGAGWWRNDVGAGLRVYVKAVVLPLLGLDVAYGLEGRRPEIYFQVGLTDF